MSTLTPTMAPVAFAGGLLVDERMGSLTISGIVCAGWQYVLGANRSVTDGVLNGTTTLTSATAAFTSADVGAILFGTGIPLGTSIASVSSGTTVIMSFVATATASGVHVSIGGRGLCAWQICDLRPFWQTAAVRGGDRVLPGATGVLPYRRRATMSPHQLPMTISGFVDHTGAAASSPMAQLQANIAYLRANLADPTNVSDGTRPAVLTKPDGSTLTGPIHVLTLTPGAEAGPVCNATLAISIPGGTLS